MANFPETKMRVKRALPGLLLQYSTADTMVGKALDARGEWEGAALELLSGLVRPGHVVLDLGAYIGTFGLAFGSMVAPSGHVHLFEPQRVLSDLIHASVALNRTDDSADAAPIRQKSVRQALMVQKWQARPPVA